MSLNKRNEIAPQMVDYDSVGDQWVPYLMKFDHPERKFKSVTTNKWGFRNTTDKNGQVIDDEYIKKASEKGEVGVVIGSSSVFGVGATSDENTLPSILNKHSNTLWLNFGGRAFNSTQELLLFILHLPCKVDKIIIFSGVNNITLSFLSESTSKVYNSFYFQSVFERAMKCPPGTYIGLRKASRILIREIKNKIFPVSKKSETYSIDERYNNILECFERDLRVMKNLSKGLEAKIYFVMQPLATWIDKELSIEEEKVFKILDEMSQDWSILSKSIGKYKDVYFSDVKRICNQLEVPFSNMNLHKEYTFPDWLFVDRVHLTDKGYEISANNILKEFEL